MSLSSSTAADGDELVGEHQHGDAAELPAPPPREILDAAGELLRALAAPVRIAIVLQLHVLNAACTNWSTRSACRSRW